MKRLVLCLSFLLVACGGGKPAPERYSLTASASEVPACRGELAIKFHAPNAAPGIDTTRIVVMDRPNHLTHYQGVSWSAPAPREVQNSLADNVEQSGMFTTVGTDLDTVPVDYEVELELREFHVDLTGEPSVRIRMTANVMRADGARVVKSMILKRQAPIAGAKMEGIVAIFNEQMHSISEELQARLGRSIPACRH